MRLCSGDVEADWYAMWPYHL